MPVNRTRELTEPLGGGLFAIIDDSADDTVEHGGRRHPGTLGQSFDDTATAARRPNGKPLRAAT